MPPVATPATAPISASPTWAEQWAPLTGKLALTKGYRVHTGDVVGAFAVTLRDWLGEVGIGGYAPLDVGTLPTKPDATANLAWVQETAWGAYETFDADKRFCGLSMLALRAYATYARHDAQARLGQSVASQRAELARQRANAARTTAATAATQHPAEYPQIRAQHTAAVEARTEPREVAARHGLARKGGFNLPADCYRISPNTVYSPSTRMRYTVKPVDESAAARQDGAIKNRRAS